MKGDSLSRIACSRQRRTISTTRGSNGSTPRGSDPRAPAPFLKWAGGKRQLLPHLRELVPEPFRSAQFTPSGRYFEPFLGGGALYFDLRRTGWNGLAFLGDMNEALVRTYLGVKGEVEDVIEALVGRPATKKDPGWPPMRYRKAEYLKRRDKDPLDYSAHADAAAWLIYMNRCCFNGLWRVNQNGKFNVPIGRYDNPTICDAPTLHAASLALSLATISHQDFELTLADAREGDLAYLDPPYAPLSETSSFTKYAKENFTDKDQKRLRDSALALKRRGVHVILSNSSAPIIRELYTAPDFEVREVDAKRAINSKAELRGEIKELLIT